MRARALFAGHRHAEALALSSDVAREAGDGGQRSGGVTPWRSLLAEAHLHAGDPDTARALADEEVAVAARLGPAREVGRALRVRAAVDRDGAGQRLTEAVMLLRDAAAPLELASALVDLGALRRRAGERVESRAPLSEGLELAHRQGAVALEERARAELRASGARPRAALRSGVAALTPSERRVASLAAAGLSNLQIAQELFVTVRTVEMHLSAAYRKLDISSRTALPEALG
jgi:DNA-binding NarL/FixJ family response regulator